MRAADVFEDAPCIKDPVLWESTDLWDHQAAAAECHTNCTAIEACREWLLEAQSKVSPAMRDAGGGVAGTWAGILVGAAEADDPRWPTCGTEGGYYSHRRNGETPCEDCWEAHSQADAERYARRRAQETA